MTTPVSGVRAAAGSVSSTPGRGWRRYRSRTFYLFALLWILGFLLLTLTPLAYALHELRRRKAEVAVHRLAQLR